MFGDHSEEVLLFIGLFAIKCKKEKKKIIHAAMARKPKRSHRAYKEWAPSVK